MKLASPTPELPVADVPAAQAYYRDRLGFEVAWYNGDGGIGAVAHGDCAIFLRKAPVPSEPSIFWIFAEDIDAAYEVLVAKGAEITDPIENKPWGLRQFTFRDLNGNLFHVHHDV